MEFIEWDRAFKLMNTLELVQAKNSLVCLQAIPVFNRVYIETGIFELIHNINNELNVRAFRDNADRMNIS